MKFGVATANKNLPLICDLYIYIYIYIYINLYSWNLIIQHKCRLYKKILWQEDSKITNVKNETVVILLSSSCHNIYIYIYMYIYVYIYTWSLINSNSFRAALMSCSTVKRTSADWTYIRSHISMLLSIPQIYNDNQ